MENRFYKDDDFENFLRETTDNFSMYPSKKVWYSIYNDLHPSKKWPSLAVCLLLITAILYVGVSNNNSINQSKLNLSSQSYFNNLAPETGLLAINPTANKSGTTLTKNNSQTPLFNTVDFLDNTSNNTDQSSEVIVVPNSKVSPSENTGDLHINGSISELNTSVKDKHIVAKTAISQNEGLLTQGENEKNLLASNDLSQISNVTNGETLTDLSNSSDNNTDNTIESQKIDLTKDINKLTQSKEAFAISIEDKNWIENYAFNHKKAISRFKSLGSVQYYVAPSIGFRTLKKNNNFDVPAFAVQPGFVSPTSNNNLSINDEVTQKSAINMEAGIAVLYNISKKLRIKAGAQLNYTSYISFADNLAHTTQTSLLLNDGKGGYTLATRKSSYGNSINGIKDAKLNNNTVQISLPIGADIKLAGKNNLKWYAGGTIQPSYIASGDVYAISTDTHNYVHENDLLRKWNVSAGLETFVSFKTPAGIIISAGPQMRYQLFSTYNKQYSYTEKLYNFGIKLGITKTF